MLRPEGGELLVFSPSFQMRGHVLRVEGLKRELSDSYPEIHPNTIYELTGSDIKDYQITKEALTSHPDTTLIVCPGAYSSGNLQAIRELGYLHNAKLICYDYSDIIGTMIQNREIAAAITQRPQEQGYIAVKILFEYLSASKEPRFKNHYIQTHILLKENLSEIQMIRDEYQQTNFPKSQHLIK